MKPLEQVPATDAAALTRALARALAGGPAVWPVPALPAPAPAAPRASANATSVRVGSRSFVGNPLARPAEVEERVALVVETSGSTASPKRVALSGEALVASADATHDALGGPGQWLLALPGHYIAGIQVLVRGTVAGTEPIVLGSAGGDGGFDAAAFAAASAELMPGVPHYTSLVPVQLARLVEAAERDAFVAAALRSYDAILLGGQAAPAGLVEHAADLGAHVVRTYGSSETAGGCVYDGMPLDGVELRAVDGEIRLAGPMLAEGYLGDPERTAATFVVDRGRRWYRTGDLGTVGADGRLRITGRADDVVISGGVKVALGEVQRAVRTVPGFAAAVVVAVDDPEWGQRPGVAVEAFALERARADRANRPDGAAQPALLAALAAATDAAGLPAAGRPVRLAILDRLPLLASGKPDRRALDALMRNA